MECDWLMPGDGADKVIMCGITFPVAKNTLSVDCEQVGNVFWREAEKVPDFEPEEDDEADPLDKYETKAWGVDLSQILTSFEVIERCKLANIYRVSGLMRMSLAEARAMLGNENQLARFLDEIARIEGKK
jgi:hypothetical protein